MYLATRFATMTILALMLVSSTSLIKPATQGLFIL